MTIVWLLYLLIFYHKYIVYSDYDLPQLMFLVLLLFYFTLLFVIIILIHKNMYFSFFIRVSSFIFFCTSRVSSFFSCTLYYNIIGKLRECNMFSQSGTSLLLRGCGQIKYQVCILNPFRAYQRTNRAKLAPKLIQCYPLLPPRTLVQA